MRWVVGLLILALLGRAQAVLAQEETLVEEDTVVEDQGFDQAIAKFNNNIKGFPSWEAFKAEIVAKLSPDTSGTCYRLTGGGIQPVEVTKVGFHRPEGKRWKKTGGKGWRQRKKDRSFIEYRVNEKAGVLLRIEGVKPRFFFAATKKICEFPL